MKRINKLFNDFLEDEKTAGIILIICTIISLIIANSIFQNSYLEFWKTPIRLQFGDFNFFNHHGEPLSLDTFINDALMTVFFLMVGLELAREIYIGELSNVKQALLPIMAALGGILIPAGIYAYFNYNTETASGTGIPMATDIAFALGVLSLLGKRIPLALRVFLTALAVIDDLGAIIVIALFYTQDLSMFSLGTALGIWAILLILNLLKVKSLIPYIIGGIIMWYFMLNSGVHATITGVLLAFVIPFGDGGKNTKSYQLLSALHHPVSFLILPVFALANTAIVIDSGFPELFSQPYTLGIFLGLVLGKPLGIFLFTFIACKSKLCVLPSQIGWKQLMGISFLGGIGFTMSIFITLLAFDPVMHYDYINNAKFMILISSLCAAILGFTYLNFIYRKKNI
ncbi:Na+/H+ antiporter NhaA [Apibacter muscae]|uniref:Na+/H+ antiporter NhaA n=1 Tax=Apibacter muscae TaxID=2509004 RepID=UPI0011ADA01C|nr:Na+/H+ antiporter NhaA [Apibacter muscae]TWP25090.1 Na+/H+ antiporter NhaA [Apibacter muscae]